MRTLAAHRVGVITAFLILVATMAAGALMATDRTAHAAPASTLNYQARLKTSSGALPPDGYYNLQFKLHTAANDGTAVWTESYTAGSRIRVANGYVSVQLGSLAPFSSASPAIDWSQEMWLTMNVGGMNPTTPVWDGEMSPRLKLTSVPYAFKAEQAKTLQTTDGTNTSTLGWETQTASRSILLPDEDVAGGNIVCLRASVACGFAPATGGTGYIQNGTEAQPAPANFNIDGTGQASTLNATTSLQLNGADINTAGTLSNVAYLNQVTTFKATTDSTAAFRVQNAAGTSTVLNVDTAGGVVGVGTAPTNETFTAPPELQPDVLPTSVVRPTSFSPDSQYLAIGSGGTTRIYVYKRVGDTFAKLATPAGADLPTGDVLGTAWSPDGQYLSAAHANSPYVTTYKRSGDTFTKLANPTGGLPTGTARGAAWSPDGHYLTVAHFVAPYVTVYRRDGDSLTKLANSIATGDLPTGNGYSTAWSPNGNYMSVGQLASPYLVVYKRIGERFVRLATPSDVPPVGAGYVPGMEWSPDGAHIVLSLYLVNTNPSMWIYKLSDDTLSKLPDPTGIDSSVAGQFDVAYSPDGSRLATVGDGAMGRLTILARSGDTYSLSQYVTEANTDTGRGVTWSPDGQYVVQTYLSASPALRIFKVGSGSHGDLAVHGNTNVAGQVVAQSLVAPTLASDGATFGSLVATSSTVQNKVVADTLTVGASLTLGASDVAPGMLQLGVSSSVSDPATGSNGMMYYNSSMGALRCYIGGAWGSCVAGAPENAFADGGNSFGGTAILGTSDPEDFTLVANSNTVANFTATGNIVFTPSSELAVKNASDATVLGVNTTTNEVDINADTAVNGQLTTAGGLSVAGSTTISSTLDVAGVTAITDDLTVQNSGGDNALNVNSMTGVVTIGQQNAMNWGGAMTDVTTAVGEQPADGSRSVAWSPDNQYLAVGSRTTAPYLSIYKRVGDALTKLPDSNIPDLPPNVSWGVAWSPDGTYLSVAHNTTPRLSIYKRSGDTFARLASPAPADLPANNSYNTDWSPDGKYVAFTLQNSVTNLVIYKRSGDTFTKLTTPTMVAGNGQGVKFSGDGTYLTMTTNTSPYLAIYKHSGDTFTLMTSAVDTLPTGVAWGISWSGDGTYMAIAHYEFPNVTVYKRSGDTFSKLPDGNFGGALPGAHGVSVAFSNSGRYLVVGTTWVPWLTMYERDGDTFTAVSVPNPPDSQPLSLAFSGDNDYLAVAVADSPSDQHLRMYRAGGGGAPPGELVVGGTITADSLQLGNPASASLSGAKLVVTLAEIQTTLRLGSATNGISFNDAATGSSGNKLRLYGNARNAKTIALTPEYAGSSLNATGVGSMTSGYDNAARKNYYRWTTAEASAQVRDVVVRYRLPADWSEWSSATPICIEGYQSSSTATATMTIKDGGGAADVSTVAIDPSSDATWGNLCFTLDGAYEAGDTISIRIAMTAQSSSVFMIGRLTMSYLSAF